MNKTTVMVLAALASATAALGAQDAPTSGKNLGSVQGGEFKAALGIIEKKCTACHSSSVINRAISSHKNMAEIQKAMERKGASLTRNEKQVLGIYWNQHPLKEKAK